jgi:hypothetical protein
MSVQDVKLTLDIAVGVAILRDVSDPDRHGAEPGSSPPAIRR